MLPLCRCCRLRWQESSAPFLLHFVGCRYLRRLSSRLDWRGPDGISGQECVQLPYLSPSVWNCIPAVLSG